MSKKLKVFRGTIRILATQFDGSNSIEVAKWIRGWGVKATARGRYVAVDKYESVTINMTRTDWAVVNVETSEVTIYDHNQMTHIFEINS